MAALYIPWMQTDIANLANNTFSGNSSGHAIVSPSRSSGGAANLSYSNLVHNTFYNNQIVGGLTIEAVQFTGIQIYPQAYSLETIFFITTPGATPNAWAGS